MTDTRSENPQANAASENRRSLRDIVQALRESREISHKVRHQGRIRELPSRRTLEKILDGLAAALFPTHYGQSDLTDDNIDYFVGDKLSESLNLLTEQIRRGLFFVTDRDDRHDADLRQQAVEIAGAFAARLPDIRALLVSDLQAAYQGDPAATSFAEILLCYPGMIAIMYHRLAHALQDLGAPFLARMVAGIAHSKTGIDIHPAAKIGASFFIDHGVGVVIGETAEIGCHVRLYQAVTLGAKRFPADENGVLLKGQPRHPIVEDHVTIYAGATILGRVTIGRGSSIGGNVWLTHGVPPGSVVTQGRTRHEEDFSI